MVWYGTGRAMNKRSLRYAGSVASLNSHVDDYSFWSFCRRRRRDVQLDRAAAVATAPGVSSSGGGRAPRDWHAESRDQPVRTTLGLWEEDWNDVALQSRREIFEAMCILWPIMCTMSWFLTTLEQSTHRASVHQAAKLVAALLRVARVTAGLAKSNGSLPPGLWLTSPACWLPRTGGLDARCDKLATIKWIRRHLRRSASRRKKQENWPISKTRTTFHRNEDTRFPLRDTM